MNLACATAKRGEHWERPTRGAFAADALARSTSPSASRDLNAGSQTGDAARTEFLRRRQLPVSFRTTGEPPHCLRHSKAPR